jgi:hypothetical protein
MAETPFWIKVAEDRQRATIEIGPVGGPSGPVGLNLEQLTAVINLLGQVRSRMVEGTPNQSLDGVAVETVIGGTWCVQVAKIDGSLLAFDHPAYGPVAFAIPRDDVAKIVKILSAHLALPKPPQGKPS